MEPLWNHEGLLSSSKTFMSQSTLYKSGLRASVLTIRLNAIKDIGGLEIKGMAEKVYVLGRTLNT